MAEELDPLKVSDSGASGSERRTEKRKAIQLNKIFSAEMHTQEEIHPFFLYVVDMSESGMRITTDQPFPETASIPLKIQLDEPLEVTAQVVWQRTLVGGTNVIGMHFLVISPEDQEKVMKFMDKYSPEGRRRSFRLNRVLAVEMLMENVSQKFYPLTIDLSSKGMKLTNDFAIPEGIEIPFKILLDFDKPPIEVVGKVSWQKPTSFGTFMAGLEFIKISNEDDKRIDDFIDRAIAGTLDDQIVKPQQMGKDVGWGKRPPANSQP